MKDEELLSVSDFYKSDLTVNRNLHFAISGLSFLIIIAIVLLQPINTSLFISLSFAIICLPISFAVAWSYKQCILFGQQSQNYLYAKSNYLLFIFSTISIISLCISIGSLISGISISLLWLFAIVSIISLSFILLFNRRYTNYLRKEPHKN